MNSKNIAPHNSINKAYLKIKPIRSNIECFKINLISLLNDIKDNETEEFHKNILSDFLKNTYYSPNYYINTKGRNDLVIHNGRDSKSSVGVIIETKKPSNSNEMLEVNNLNKKAMHELILYFFRERINNKNLEIKHLIATNLNEWFIFDAIYFEKIFVQNKSLLASFINFHEGRLTGNTTDYFYKEIAEPFFADSDFELPFCYININDYKEPLCNNIQDDDNKLIILYKLLSPENLLKLPFTNDSNSLDKEFYSELLYILGLTEVKSGGKFIIEREKESSRNSGSFIENAINQLRSLDKISRLSKPHLYGNTNEERLFNIALELSITWMNRILFLKLLEAQQIKYNKSDKSYSFLNIEKVNNYDELNILFFSVLAYENNARSDEIKNKYSKVPYLNSSLFEPSDIEHNFLFISQLKDSEIPIYKSTVLKDSNGKREKGKINSLEYLFEFLNAYDFSSVDSRFNLISIPAFLSQRYAA